MGGLADFCSVKARYPIEQVAEFLGLRAARRCDKSDASAESARRTRV